MSTGQPHEGSSYASQKVLQMAWHRLEHARSRVAELDRSVLAMSTQLIFAEHNIRISRRQPKAPFLLLVLSHFIRMFCQDTIIMYSLST